LILKEKNLAASEPSGYGLWSLVIINTAVFLMFAFSFYKPKTSRDWRSFGAFSAFIIALFTEMYGFPLTIYLLSGWLAKNFPGLNLDSHNSGHLWDSLLGLQGDPHFSFLHILSNLLIPAGFLLIGAAWKVLYSAQKTKQVASSGPYALVRHPQYVGFILIMFSFLLQWPTILTAIMFPILIIMYTRLAKREEKDALAEFGNLYADYQKKTPAFFPRPRFSLSELGN
jgi:protein-S-isoprenylcysteine O-methyltransferase Ste14